MDEVTEFSEAALDPEVFIPPREFKRVMQLPGGIRYPLSIRLQFRWEILKDSYQLRKKRAVYAPELRYDLHVLAVNTETTVIQYP